MPRTWGVGHRLPKSTIAQDGVLTEDPTAPDGVKWAPASVGAPGVFYLNSVGTSYLAVAPT